MRGGISFMRSPLQMAPIQMHAHRHFSSKSGDDNTNADVNAPVDAVDPTMGAADAGIAATSAADAAASTDMSAIVEAASGAASLGYWPSELVQKGIE